MQSLGYYIRFKAIETVFCSWFTDVPSSIYSKTQIISLGAGFDSSYFRLKKRDIFPPGCKYIEIDYKDVLKRKLEYIALSEFSNLLNLCNKQVETNSNILLNSEEYVMLGVDMQNCKELENCFHDLEIDFNVPTLFLSECALTYINLKSSNSLIHWVQAHFPNCAIVLYEQVHDDDGFTLIMKNHFKSLGCPLKSLTHRLKEHAHSRFIQMGWSSCSSISMLYFYMNFSKEEKQRIQNLELFDEYEMWHEKCRHYVLIWASQGIISIPEAFENKEDSVTFNYTQLGSLSFSCRPAHELLQRFGHQVALLSSRFLIVSGGFGQFQKRHQRLSGLTCYDTISQSCCIMFSSDSQDHLGQRMFHTMSKLSNNSLIIVGGRSSPKKIFSSVVSVNCENVIESQRPMDSFIAKKVTDMPLPTWRHSACIVLIAGIENIFIFGGRTSNNDVTNRCHILNSESWSFSEVPYQENTPSPRYSHSSTCVGGQKVYITCGLSKEEKILNSVHVFDIETYTWSVLQVAGLLPRYSHNSHYHNNAIFLVGGITGLSYVPYSIGMINLIANSAFEFTLGYKNPEYPLILSNHCCYVHEDHVIITGGGGNCFSFGTHFNKLATQWTTDIRSCDFDPWLQDNDNNRALNFAS
ncbi:hypothetical protein NPIL_396311 [Nephila pilipes]|uniref:tRNA wybutosine-synthesizing protein 4 n=1 Tax=Nephila pilipes TaxID=299642 RepID=A0A8X6K8Y9_NEPPI|nr:hypothetical protein NPIL_396311 [Nephila pilipes]